MKHIYICSSKIDGLGISIGENVKKGEVVAHIKGEMKFKVNKSLKDTFANPDWVGIAKDQWIDPEKPYKFLNHSCNPTVGVKGRVTLVVLRDMKEGEEVTVDYSTIEGDPNWEMECACGEGNCRKIVKSVQFMPEDQFEKYLPYVSTYFKNLYLKRSKNVRMGRI